LELYYGNCFYWLFNHSIVRKYVNQWAEMTTHSVIFSADEVRNMLDGTMTRVMREVKPQPVLSHYGYTWTKSGRNTVYAAKLVGMDYSHWDVDKPASKSMVARCPFGTVGDQLIVKETWGVYQLDCEGMKEYPNILYKANRHTRLYISDEVWKYNTEKFSWRSPVTMPRWASRITLEITGIAVEQVDGVWMWVIDFKQLEKDGE
jgi:hypothetical protein